MDHDGIVRLSSDALLLCLMLSLPAVLVAASVGLIVSLVQAITSLQEQSIGQAAKMIAVVLTLLVTSPWGAAMVLRHAESLFRIATT
jgi:type III secretion protein S